MGTASHLINQTTDRLMRYIIDNNLQAGSKLPTELELSLLLQVGRSTIREAVKALVGRNILEVRQGSGTFLVREQIGIIEDPFGLAFIKNKKKLIFDLLEVRMAIEPRIAAIAATVASDDDITVIKKLAEETENTINNNGDYTQKDTELHAKIAQTSGNLVIPILLPIIQRAQRTIIVLSRPLQEVNKQETIKFHRLIVEAIEKHDPVGAADAMVLHIAYARNFIRCYFNEIGEIP
ncbi:MAG: FadR family transcriptional regulator [Endomicrobia bacterium]|nr:FadR family transcriptional regulator [Endomicrobiia bacterium]